MRKSLFRKTFQAVGVGAVCWAIYRSFLVVILILDGEIDAGLGILSILLILCVSGGIGMLMTIFDPHKVFQLNIFALHRLVDQDRTSRSFADKIGADDDDEF